MTESAWYLLHNGTQYPLADRSEAVFLAGRITADRDSGLGMYVEFIPAGMTESVRIEPIGAAEIIGL